MSKALNIHFSNEKLDLDYLVFNLPRFRTRMLKVTKIFHKYGFNSRIYNADTEKYSTILYEKTFTHWLTFTLENELWLTLQVLNWLISFYTLVNKQVNINYDSVQKKLLYQKFYVRRIVIYILFSRLKTCPFFIFYLRLLSFYAFLSWLVYTI